MDFQRRVPRSKAAVSLLALFFSFPRCSKFSIDLSAAPGYLREDPSLPRFDGERETRLMRIAATHNQLRGT